MSLPAYGIETNLTGLAWPTSNVNPGAGTSAYDCTQKIAASASGAVIVVRDDYQAVLLNPADESGVEIGVTFAQQFASENAQGCWGISYDNGIWTALVWTGYETGTLGIGDQMLCLQTSTADAPTTAADWTLGRTIYDHDTTSSGLFGFLTAPTLVLDGSNSASAVSFPVLTARLPDGSLVQSTAGNVTIPGGVASTYDVYMSSGGAISFSPGGVHLFTIVVTGDTSSDWSPATPVDDASHAPARLLDFSLTPGINHSSTGDTLDHTGVGGVWVFTNVPPYWYLLRTDDFTGITVPTGLLSSLSGSVYVTLSTWRDPTGPINYRKLTIANYDGSVVWYTQTINSDGVPAMNFLSHYVGTQWQQSHGGVTITNTPHLYTPPAWCAFGAGAGGVVILGTTGGPWGRFSVFTCTSDADPIGVGCNSLVRIGAGVRANYAMTIGLLTYYEYPIPSKPLLDIRFAGAAPAAITGTGIHPSGAASYVQFAFGGWSGYYGAVSGGTEEGWAVEESSGNLHHFTSGAHTNVLSGCIPVGDTILYAGRSAQNPTTQLCFIHGAGGVARLTIVTLGDSPSKVGGTTFAWQTNAVDTWDHGFSVAGALGGTYTSDNPWESACTSW